ncbi:MAG: OB-fold domain-containing protein, partial [Gammaproteobacteria bacterium]|nr:OB-fold domain-containing protein [Gammaproteobacteria bacterium]
CLSFDIAWNEAPGRGRIYSWQRSWHPVHPALRDRTPYISVLVELPQAGNVRLLGNLLGDVHQDVIIGTEVEAVFEHHNDADPAFTLVQWQAV